MLSNTLKSQLSIRQVAAFMAFSVLMTTGAFADTYRKGQHIEPAFEGWRPNPDGTFNFMFGYMNENWEEEPDVQVGPDNGFSPGDADRGQPVSLREAWLRSAARFRWGDAGRRRP